MSNAPEMQFGRGAKPMAPVVGRSGRLSLIIWLVAFVFAVVSFLLFSLTPAGAPEATRTVTTYFFIVVFLALAPIAHVVGFVLGLVAIFRRGQRTGAGVIGCILNGLSVAGILLLIWAAAGTMGSFT